MFLYLWLTSDNICQIVAASTLYELGESVCRRQCTVCFTEHPPLGHTRQSAVISVTDDILQILEGDPPADMIPDGVGYQHKHMIDNDQGLTVLIYKRVSNKV